MFFSLIWWFSIIFLFFNDIIRWYFYTFRYYSMIFLPILILFGDIFVLVAICWYFYIFFIFEKAGTYRARRGAGTSTFGTYFSKKYVFHNLQHRYSLGNSTLWSASSRRCDHTNSHQNPAYVSLFREKSLICYKKSSFSTVYRRATASGTVSRGPGRSTCIYHTQDELRSPSDGRVMIIWMVFVSRRLSPTGVTCNGGDI